MDSRAIQEVKRQTLETVHLCVEGDEKDEIKMSEVSSNLRQEL